MRATSQAAGPLLALLDEEPEAAEVLALVDTSAVVDEIEQRWQRDGGVFLAVALAKSGRADALVAELERLSSDPDLAEEWLYTDETTELEQALVRAAPLPDEVRAAVDREWPGWFAGHLVSDVLFAPPSERAESSTWKTSPADNLSAAERELVQDALGSGLPEHDVYQAEPVVKLADDLYRPLAAELERSHFDSLLVSELLVLAARGHRQSGDDAVLLAGALRRGLRARRSGAARSLAPDGRGRRRHAKSDRVGGLPRPSVAVARAARRRDRRRPADSCPLHRRGRKLGRDRRPAADAGGGRAEGARARARRPS